MSFSLEQSEKMGTQCYYKQFKEHINSINFHSVKNLISVGTVGGNVSTWEWESFEKGLRQKWDKGDIHSAAVRHVRITPNGKGVVSCSSDKTVVLTDLERGTCKWRVKGHGEGVNAVACIDDNLIASGDDEGELVVWDVRIGNKGSCVSKITEFDDCISGIEIGKDSSEILAICADQIGCFDFRNNRLKVQAISDQLEHELSCLVKVKNGEKVACATQTGCLCLFSYGYWGDFNDRILISKEALNDMVKLNENLICTCGDDGKIYIVEIHPNRVAGVLKRHEQLLPGSVGYSDCLSVNGQGSILAFVGNSDTLYITSTDEVSQITTGDANEEFFDDL
ncbi:bifunctional WD40 repeat/WD40-repeat-containing domain superfamily/WD40-YVTN repeat-like-containing domain superfamily [Babesia duncani]|uniref:Bifunctional WD40 repeat/WD40-repeat-containing domain superfamily/WD40-YVTN repeat-like-containing domain superfamily n=1 Tax=Babesia duncani TaxID=323732 RepID=A0AAD9PI33_9APIC|nr:bifunctional WD40 repeat/WD40-repeat-containing domain superfamily/WD40-YVTN repeat-like-containing domain superfamily [Babesia duncani]